MQRSNEEAANAYTEEKYRIVNQIQLKYDRIVKKIEENDDIDPLAKAELILKEREKEQAEISAAR